MVQVEVEGRPESRDVPLVGGNVVLLHIADKMGETVEVVAFERLGVERSQVRGVQKRVGALLGRRQHLEEVLVGQLEIAQNGVSHEQQRVSLLIIPDIVLSHFVNQESRLLLQSRVFEGLGFVQLELGAELLVEYVHASGRSVELFEALEDILLQLLLARDLVLHADEVEDLTGQDVLLEPGRNFRFDALLDSISLGLDAIESLNRLGDAFREFLLDPLVKVNLIFASQILFTNWVIWIIEISILLFIHAELLLLCSLDNL